MSSSLHSLKIGIYADGADTASMIRLYHDPLIKGLTTNPTLMKKAGITDYEIFAREVLETVRTKPISFEVFSDDFDEMHRQALKLQSWQENVFVKIPITNTRGESSLPLIHALASDGVKLNVTAILTLDQVRGVSEHLQSGVPAIVSVFAGRVADTGVDPVPLMRACKELIAGIPNAQLLWASVREVLNIYQAEAAGSDIVTVPHDLLAKAMKMAGQDLAALSLETVEMFHRDAQSAGYSV
jgi:transaldolase